MITGSTRQRLFVGTSQQCSVARMQCAASKLSLPVLPDGVERHWHVCSSRRSLKEDKSCSLLVTRQGCDALL